MTNDLQKSVEAAIRRERRLGRDLLRPVLAEASSFVLREEAYFDVAHNLWAGLDTPRALACALLLKYKEYGQLVRMECHPNAYLYEELSSVSPRGPGRFADDYQATRLLAKWEFSHPDLDPESACILADQAAELTCGLTNRRLRQAQASHTCDEPAYWHLIFEMQADIARVLGGFDPQKWAEACRFGPGKALGQEGTVDYEKLVSRPSCTDRFLPYGVELISCSTPWLECLSGRAPDPLAVCDSEDEWVYTFDVQIEPGDRNTTVPKNAKTRRGIRSQPGLNVYAQLGLGRLMRDRLRNAGLDLDDQLPNQRLAQLGSRLGGNYVTIDLKGASGHIASALPPLLFRDIPRWLFAMDLCRTTMMSPHGDGGKTWIPLQSYSAMGNGYTFELETLIFWSAVRAVRRVVKDTLQYRVYGDDIICSREVAQLLIPFLLYLGFPVNEEKTFLEGPFRESCGADYWHGINVRPIHLSASAEELKESNEQGISVLRWVQVCNSLRRQAWRRNRNLGCDPRYLPAWRAAFLYMPRNLRQSLKGPWSIERDDYIITHDDDARTNPMIRRCGLLQTAISPRLSVSAKPRLVPSFLGARAALLYRLVTGDSVAVRYDQSRSWLRRVLHAPYTERTQLQARLDAVFGQNSAETVIYPDVRRVQLGAGWEVFQPVGTHTEWYAVG